MAVASLVACAADPTGTTTTPLPVHTVTASVTGTVWTMTHVRAIYLVGTGTLILTAIDSLHSPASEITLFVDHAFTTGVYTPQNNTGMVVDYFRNDSTWNTLSGKLGSISFTALTGARVAGSFDVRVNPDPVPMPADSTTTIALIGKFDVSIP